MITLHLDEEQAQMVVEACEAGMKFMDFRLARVDPTGELKNSQRLQQTKLENVKHQMSLGPVSEWKDLKPQDKQQVREFCRLLADTKDSALADACYSQLVAFVTENRHEAAPLITYLDRSPS